MNIYQNKVFTRQQGIECIGNSFILSTRYSVQNSIQLEIKNILHSLSLDTIERQQIRYGKDQEKDE